MGLKFRKIPDVVAPNFCTPTFQNTIQRTVEMSPVYKSDVIKRSVDICNSEASNVKWQ